MNTIRSTWLGWGTLCVAGGGAYFFAKRQINADRAEKFNKERQKQERMARYEQSIASGSAIAKTKRHQSTTSTESDDAHAKVQDHVGSPSKEANENAAPVKHAVDDSESKPRVRSKYEGEPYKSKKGDRFS